MHIERLRHVSYGEDAHGIVGRKQEAPGLGRGLRGQVKALMMAAMPKGHQATLSLILTVSRRLGRWVMDRPASTILSDE